MLYFQNESGEVFAYESAEERAKFGLDGLVPMTAVEVEAHLNPPEPPPTALDIDAERNRRIDAGIEFQGVMFQSRATDRENIAGAAQLGFMALVGGAEPNDLRWSSEDQDYAWIASDNSLVPMDAPTMVAFGKAMAERKQALIFAARQLKDMEPIPADFTDDKWWS